MTVTAQRTMAIDTLYNMRDERRALATIARGLQEEWGAFGPKDNSEMNRMVDGAGNRVYVGREVLDRQLGSPLIVLQTGVADVKGEPHRLTEKHPTYCHITSGETWTGFGEMKGDTALLLQITTLDEDARNNGIGSVFRGGVLSVLDDSIRWALTTTPVPRDFYDKLVSSAVPLEELEHGVLAFPPAVRFHYNGGGRIAGISGNYKLPYAGREQLGCGRQSNTAVAFLRYSRAPDGKWTGIDTGARQMNIVGREMTVVRY